MSKYNHDLKNIHKACGISDERVEEIQELLKNIQRNAKTWSELVEAFDKTFESNELAFIHVIGKKNQVEYAESKMRGMFKSKDEGPKQIKGFMMGSGGEA